MTQALCKTNICKSIKGLIGFNANTKGNSNNYCDKGQNFGNFHLNSIYKSYLKTLHYICNVVSLKLS